MDWVADEVAAYDMPEAMDWTTIEPITYMDWSSTEIQMEWQQVKECVWRNLFKYFKYFNL